MKTRRFAVFSHFLAFPLFVIFWRGYGATQFEAGAIMNAEFLAQTPAGRRIADLLIPRLPVATVWEVVEAAEISTSAQIANKADYAPNAHGTIAWQHTRGGLNTELSRHGWELISPKQAAHFRHRESGFQLIYLSGCDNTGLPEQGVPRIRHNQARRKVPLMQANERILRGTPLIAPVQHHFFSSDGEPSGPEDNLTFFLLRHRGPNGETRMEICLPCAVDLEFAWAPLSCAERLPLSRERQLFVHSLEEAPQAIEIDFEIGELDED